MVYVDRDFATVEALQPVDLASGKTGNGVHDCVLRIGQQEVTAQQS